MIRYLVGAFLTLLLGGAAEVVEATTPTAHAIGNCNTNCRTRQYFKWCGTGTTDGSCRYYEQDTCVHCQINGWCDATDFASPWPCKRKLNTTHYEVDWSYCIRHCGCTDGMLLTESSFFNPAGAGIDGHRYYCQVFDEIPAEEVSRR